MRITQDKFGEAKYHFARLKEKLDLISIEKEFISIVDKIFEFRYELNSFVNSYRATTFALQNEHKSSHGELFANWYEKARTTITGDKFSKIIQELRNINQKEGNIYSAPQDL